MYIEHEIYHMAYNKLRNSLNDYQFIYGHMIKWDGFITFCENMSIKRYLLHLKL